MCPQSPSQLVEQYRKEQRLLLNKNLFESDLKNKIEEIEDNTRRSLVQTQQQKEKCEDFLKKLEECKFSAIGE